jgi:hypothetical protein
MAGTTVADLVAYLRLVDTMSPDLRKSVANADKSLGDLKESLDKSVGERVMGSITEGIGKLGGALQTNVGMPILAGIAAGVVALGAVFIASAGSMIAHSSAVVDLADKYRLSTDAVQRFKYAAEQSGTSIESLVQGSSLLAKNLGEGSDETRQAIDALGLSFANLRNQSPEQQLGAVLQKISAIKNPTDQAAVAAQLLGKSFRELLPLAGDLENLTKRAEELGLVLAEKDVRAAEELGDALDTLLAMFTALVDNIGAAITSNESLHVLIEGLTRVFAVMSKQVSDNREGLNNFVSNGVILTANALVLLVDAIQLAVDVWDALHNVMLSIIVVGADVGLVFTKIAAAMAFGSEKAQMAAKGMIDDLNFMKVMAGREAQEVMEANQAKANSIAVVRQAVVELEKNVTAAAGKQHEFTAATKATAPALDLMGTEAKRAAKEMAEFQKQLGANTAKSMKSVDEQSAEFRKAHELKMKAFTEEYMANHKLGEEAKKWSQELANENLPAMARAFAEIDQRAEAMKSQINDSVPNAEALRKKIDETAAAAKRAALAAMGIKGSLSAALKDLPNVILGAIQGGGNVLKAVGSSLGGALGQGIANQAGKFLGDKLGKTLGSAVGSVIPIVGTMLGSVVGSGIGKLIGGLFGGDKEKKQVEEMRRKFLESAGGIEELKRQAKEANIPLENLFNARKVKDYERAVKEVSAALDTQNRANEAVQQAMERWGLTVDEMGPKFAAQRLNEQAMSLYQDWEVLRASGADMLAVTEKMAPSINEWFNSAIAAGQGIPENMRPMLEKMLEMGTLVDANGEKLTSLEGVNFTQTLEEGLQRTIAAINALVVALGGIPTEVPPVQVPVVPVYGSGGSGGANGGYNHDYRAAAGFDGTVYGPTSILAGERGPESVSITPRGKTPQGQEANDEAMREMRNMSREVGSLIRTLPMMIKGAMATSV